MRFLSSPQVGSAPNYTLPLVDGASGQVLKTNGSGTVTWQSDNNSGGTVTSVSGAGGYGGLTLTGTVTSSGSLTLGGTPTGTWPISVSGSAATATSAATWTTARTLTIGSTGKSVNGSANVSWSLAEIGAAATSHTHVITNITDSTRWWNNFGDNHSTRTSFDATTPSYGFGWRYVQGSTNGPATSGTQFYSLYVGLGNDYPATGAGSYGMYMAIDRNVDNPYLSVRYNENNSLGSWRKIWAGRADFADSAGTATTATTATTTTGNAGSATVLQTARTINGTSFNGSTDITTATWGTARTLTIGNTGKSVNGGADVSWSIAEIGALPLTGGNLTGNTSVSSGVSFLFSGISDTNWRIGRNIVTESGNQLTSNTLQFIAAAAAGQGWQFVGSTGVTRFELDASNGNAWFNGGNVAIGVSSASYKLDVGGQFRASTSSNLVGFVKSTSTFGAAISYEDPSSGGNDAIYAGALGSSFFIATGYSRRLIVDSNGNTYPQEDRFQDLGGVSNRWKIVYCETLDSAGIHESNLKQEDISMLETGTVLVWKNGSMHPCSSFADHMRMGIAVKGAYSPLMQGAEPVLCTGDVKEGQYLVTSEKIGHAIGVDRSYVVENHLFDCVIGKALESNSGDSFVVKTWVNI